MRKLILAGSLALSLGAGEMRADEVHFQCAQTTLQLHESDGTVTLEGLRDGDLDLQATAVFLVKEVIGPTSATWIDLPSYSITFPLGSNRVSVLMPINDSHYTGNRKFRVGCAGYTAPNQGMSHGYPLEIIVLEDEPFPAIGVSDIAVLEGDRLIAVFTLTPAFGRAIDLSVITRSGTASWSDFGAQPTLPILAGVTNGRLPITIVDDDYAENDEQFEIQFKGDGLLREKFTVTIIDDDHAPFPLSLDQASYVFNEASANSVTVTRGGNTSIPANATLHIVTPHPTVWPADVPFTFAAGETSKTIPLLFDDHSFSGSRSATLEVIAPNTFVAAKAQLEMIDDESMPSVSVLGSETIEGPSGQTKRLDVHVTLSAPLGVELYVTVETADGTATSDDYVPLKKRLFFPPTSVSQKVTVEIRGDDNSEADETFNVKVTECCSALAQVGVRTAAVIIRNDDGGIGQGDPATYRFERPLDGEWRETQKWIVTTVVRSGDTSAEAVVKAKFSADAARTVSQDVRFRANETRKNIRIYIDDWFYSGDAIGALELFAGPRKDDSHAVTIVEDEPRSVVAIADLEVTETAFDRATAFQLSISPPSFAPLDVSTGPQFDWKASPSKASSYDIRGLNLGQKFTIPSLSPTFSIPFTVVADSKQEADESFVFSFYIRPPAAVINDSAALCVIHDADLAGGQLKLAKRVERGTTTEVAFTLVAPAPNAEVIQVSTPTPELLDVPVQVELAKGALSATFHVTALRNGNAVVSVKLPPRFWNAVIAEPLFIYSTSSIADLPERVRVPRGGSASVNVALSVPSEDEVLISVASLDRTIAAADAWAVLQPGGSSTFQVYGASLGTTTLAITLPAELGGTTVHVPVEVIEPTSKTRATRH